VQPDRIAGELLRRDVVPRGACAGCDDVPFRQHGMLHPRRGTEALANPLVGFPQLLILLAECTFQADDSFARERCRFRLRAGQREAPGGRDDVEADIIGYGYLMTGLPVRNPRPSENPELRPDCFRSVWMSQTEGESTSMRRRRRCRWGSCRCARLRRSRA
jgi:hypothetical protein